MHLLRSSNILLLFCLTGNFAVAQKTAEAVFKQAEALSKKEDNRAALPLLLEARQLFENEGKPARVADVLSELGSTYYVLGDPDHALLSYQDMLSVARRLKDHKREAAALQRVGDLHAAQKQYKQAISDYDRAAALDRSNGDRKSEALTLFQRGVAHLYAGDTVQAIADYKASLGLSRAVADSESAAFTLYTLGAAFDRLNDYEHAVEGYLEALRMFREQHRTPETAFTLSNLGADYSYLSSYEKSIRCSEEAISIFHELKNTDAEATAINNLGSAYERVGDYAKAIEHWKKALALIQDKGPKAQAFELNNIAAGYESLNEHATALDYYRRALELLRAAQFRTGEAKTLANIGYVHANLGNAARAVENYQQALDILREVPDKPAQATILSNLGAAYTRLGNYDKAISYEESAIHTLREIKDRRHEAGALSNLMDAWARKGYPGLAALYGKQAINLYQQIRGEITGLKDDLQLSYRRASEASYRRLADVLISQGRLSEAQRVVNLLKDEEFFAFVQRDSSTAGGSSGRIELTPEEAGWSQKIDEHLVDIGRRRGELLAKPSRTAAEEDQLTKYEQMLMPGNAEFQRYVEGLGATRANTERIRDIREAEGLMQDLRELPPGTVAIYTLESEDEYRAILVTPDVQKAYEYPITAADLNRKVLAFREAVETPHADPRPRAKELFDILIGPKLAEDLRQAKAVTLMWSLDGTLRYVPLAALYDGKQYLVEQFRIEVFTPASNARLKDKPSRDWRVAGFGVTKAHGEFQPLPEVADELRGVVKSLPGEVSLDEQFTAASMKSALRKRNQVVHVASHFSFQPGNETNSFLLLGDGGKLTLADLKTFPPAAGLELLTLSACNTGLGGAGAEGKEVEGFGVLAQKKGAKAVLASLWEVSDESTSLLMQEFYRVRESTPTMSKVEALRRAQAAMLHGELKPLKPAIQNGRGSKVSWKQSEGSMPVFPENSDAPFAHPYYWAPFFLIGNWL